MTFFNVSGCTNNLLSFNTGLSIVSNHMATDNRLYFTIYYRTNNDNL